MTAEIRDFANFDEFPGELINNRYEFPQLYTVDENENKRIWKLSIRLVKDTNRQNKINWNELLEEEMPMKPEYISSGEELLPENTIAQMWALSGCEDGKITKRAPTYFAGLSNTGRANQRNELQRAMIEGRAQWLKKKKMGFTELAAVANSGKKVAPTTRKSHRKYCEIGYVFPMLAKSYAVAAKHIKYPIYVQKKYDGIRCLSFYNPITRVVHMYTRTQKEFPGYDYMRTLLAQILPGETINVHSTGVNTTNLNTTNLNTKDVYSTGVHSTGVHSTGVHSTYVEQKNRTGCTWDILYLDGELYKHGMRLQDISSEARNEDKNRAGELEYHVYDCFYRTQKLKFCDRLIILKKLFEKMTNEQKIYIKMADSHLANDEKEMRGYYEDFIAQGYEGAILRNINGLYACHATKKNDALRSKDVIKLKKKITEEFELIGYVDGKRGKDKGALIYVCKTQNGAKFNVTPKDMTYAERYQTFKDYSAGEFEKKYKGQMLTVEFEAYSTKGIPQRAKGVAIRNYE